MERILGIKEVAVIQLRDEVLAERSVHERIVDNDLLVARLEKSSESVPVLRLDVIGRQLRTIDHSQICQLVVERKVVQHMRPALELLAKIQLVQDLHVVLVHEDFQPRLQVDHIFLLLEEVSALANGQCAENWRPHHLKLSLEQPLLRRPLHDRAHDDGRVRPQPHALLSILEADLLHQHRVLDLDQLLVAC